MGDDEGFVEQDTRHAAFAGPLVRMARCSLTLLTSGGRQPFA